MPVITGQSFSSYLNMTVMFKNTSIFALVHVSIILTMTEAPSSVGLYLYLHRITSKGDNLSYWRLRNCLTFQLPRT